MRIRSVQFQTWISVFLLTTIAHARAETEIQMGVLAKRGPELCREMWGATADYLTDSIPGYRFEIIPLDFDEIYAAAARDEIDFFLTNSAIYVDLAHHHRLSRIATLINRDSQGQPQTVFGGVVFQLSRTDAPPPRSLGELKGKRIGAVNPTSFGGWLTAERELQERGLKAGRHFEVEFFETHDAVVRAVLEERVDAGVVRTNILENWVSETGFDLSRISAFPCVLHDTPQHQNFNFIHTTRLYAEWPMAAARHTPFELSRKVAVALMQLEADSSAARAARIHGWGIPLSYESVRECLRELKQPPYENYGRTTLGGAVRQHMEWALLSGFLFLLLGSAFLWAWRTNRRLQTARNLAESAAEQARKLSRAVEQSPASVVITDTRGCIEYVNPKFCDVTGYTVGEVLGKNPSVLKSGYMSRENYADLWKTIQAGEEWRGEFHNVRKNGELFWEAASISGIRDENGNITHFLAVKEDISERKALEEELAHARQMESIGVLAAGVAHEINTPLQYVGDNLQYLQDAFAELVQSLHVESSQSADTQFHRDEIPQAIEQTVEGIARVTRIVAAMRAFSHPTSGELALADINKALQSAAIISENQWKPVARVEWELDESLPLIRCEINELNQVFLNLILNARDAIAEKAEDSPGLIRITTALIDDDCRITVADTGTGMTEAVRKRVFDQFFTTKQVGKGTGQGLSIAYRIITRKHKGRISVKSTSGTGSTFEIRLPVR